MKLGSWSLSGSLGIVNALSDSDLDFVALDFEHGQNRLEDLPTATGLLRKSGKLVIARFANPGLKELQTAHDCGVDYLQVAGIRTLSDCQALFEIQSQVGWSPWVQRAYSPQLPNTNLIFQIEFAESFSEFMTSPGPFSGRDYFLGRYDLSKSMGYELGSAKDHENVRSFHARCLELGYRPWTVATGKLDLENLIRIGFEYVSLSSDFSLINQGLKSINEWAGRKGGYKSGSRD